MIPWLILLLLGNGCCLGSLGESSRLALSHEAAESFPETDQLHLSSGTIERNVPLAFDCESPASRLGASSLDSTRNKENPQLLRLGIVIDKQEGHCPICKENVDLVADSSLIHLCTICKQPFHLDCSGPWLKLRGRCAHCRGADERAKELGYVEPSPETSHPSLTELQQPRRLFSQGRSVVAQSTRSGPPSPCEGMLAVSVVLLLGIIFTVMYVKGLLRS